eukprot:5248694-Karenia_brevis.AAC.1
MMMMMMMMMIIDDVNRPWPVPPGSDIQWRSNKASILGPRGTGCNGLKGCCTVLTVGHGLHKGVDPKC